MNSSVSLSMQVILAYVISEEPVNRYKYKEESFSKTTSGSHNSIEYLE